MTGGLVVVTVVMVALVGPNRLRAKVAETRAQLGAESVDHDRG